MRTKYSKDIINKLAEQHGLTEGGVTKVVESPLKLLRRVMSDEVNVRKGIFPSVRIRRFGIFSVPHFVIKKLKKKGKID